MSEARPDDSSVESNLNRQAKVTAGQRHPGEKAVTGVDVDRKTSEKKTKAKSRTGGAGQSALEQRLREEVGGFEFGALLSGVSTISQPGIAPHQKSDSRLPGPGATPGDVPNYVPSVGLYSRPPLQSSATSSDLPTPALTATTGSIAGGPLDSARAYSDYATSRGGPGKPAAIPTAGWTYRTKRSYDFGSIIAIVIIITALCVGSALAVSYFTKPAIVPPKPVFTAPKAPAQKKPVHGAHKRRHG